MVEVAEATDLAKTLTLFQIEESLVLLAESAEEEGLTPEIEAALAAYLEGAMEKRDRASHRLDDLVEEGYIRANAQGSGSVIGGRTGPWPAES